MLFRSPHVCAGRERKDHRAVPCRGERHPGIAVAQPKVDDLNSHGFLPQAEMEALIDSFAIEPVPAHHLSCNRKNPLKMQGIIQRIIIIQHSKADYFTNSLTLAFLPTRSLR